MFQGGPAIHRTQMARDLRQAGYPARVTSREGLAEPGQKTIGSGGWAW